MSNILWIDLDIRALNICQEIENSALVFNNGLLGRVVRVEENRQNSGVYGVGVCFLTQSDKNSRDIQDLFSKLSRKPRKS